MRSFEFEREREFNLVLSKIDSTFLSPRILAKPVSAAFSIGTACDLKCMFCARQHLIPADSGFMNFQEFERLAPTLVGVKKASLFGLGDPLLNKRFLDYVRLCHRYGLETLTTTHAMHLTEEVAEGVLAEGLEELAISIDAANQELLDLLRPNADLDLTKKNVRYLARRKKETGSEFPKIILSCTTSKLNIHEMPAIVRMCAEIGIEVVCFADVIAIRPEFVKHTLRDYTEFNRYFAEAKRIAEEHGMTVAHFEQKAQPWAYQPLPYEGIPYGCNIGWDSMFVERQGETRPCCYLQVEPANYFAMPMEELLNSPAKTGLRKALMQSNVDTQCRGCFSLLPNSRARAEDVLRQAEELTSESTHLTEQDRVQLATIIQEYRGKLDEVFPLYQSRPASIVRRIIRRTVPPPLRRAIKNIIEPRP